VRRRLGAELRQGRARAARRSACRARPGRRRAIVRLGPAAGRLRGGRPAALRQACAVAQAGPGASRRWLRLARAGRPGPGRGRIRRWRPRATLRGGRAESLAGRPRRARMTLHCPGARPEFRRAAAGAERAREDGRDSAAGLSVPAVALMRRGAREHADDLLACWRRKRPAGWAGMRGLVRQHRRWRGRRVRKWRWPRVRAGCAAGAHLHRRYRATAARWGSRTGAGVDRPGPG
jgi:hypothetical protein